MKNVFGVIVVWCFAALASAGPVAVWHFDESAGVTKANDAVQDHDGILAGDADFIAGGISGNAARIGPGGSIDMGNVLQFGDEDFSLVAWVKLAEGNWGEQFLLAKHQSWYGGYFIGINYHNSTYGTAGRAWFYSIGSPGQQPTSTTLVQDGQWHFIAAVYHKGGLGEIYVDGGPAEDSRAMQVNPITNVPFRIGAIDTTAMFDGWVDEVQVYDHALTEAEVQGLYDEPGSVIGEIQGMKAGMTLWLKAEDCADAGEGQPVTTWPDASGKGLDVTMPGYDNWRRPVYVSDVINGRPAIRFDGDDFLVRPDVAGWELTSNDEATAFVVLKQAGSDARNTILGWANGGNRFMLHTTWEDILALQHGYIYTAQGNWTQPAGWDDSFHVVEFVRDNPVFECIVDGVELAPQFGTTLLDVSPRYPLYIGSDPWGMECGNYFTGDVCEIMVYDRALNVGQRYQVRNYLARRYGMTAETRVNLETFARLAEQWLKSDCTGPDWCGKADRNTSGEVDLADMIDLAEAWLQ